MAVEVQHPDYGKHAIKWKKVRDAIAGQSAVHEATTQYLPRLTDQRDDDYQAMVRRTTFYNASWRTMAGMLGMLFRKPPKITVPDGVKKYLDDITLSGHPFAQFAQDVAFENISISRGGILVDHPPQPVTAEGQQLTVVQAEALGMRPSMQLYKAESITNHKTMRVGGKTVLSMVVLVETTPVQAENEFAHKTERRWRVLDLGGPGGVYRQRVFRKKTQIMGSADIGADELVSQVLPLMDGKPLDYIPFFFFGPEGIDPDFDCPVLMDLVDLNLQHYMVSADYEHGCHFTGLPTPWIAGYTPVVEEGKPAEKLYVGSQSAWVFSDPQAKAGYLEFTGQGLGELRANLDRKEQQMAVLGARMLAAEKKQAETATTSAIHRTGENSILSNIALSTSLALKKALTVFCEWAGMPGDVDVEINREFQPVMVDAPTFVALVQAYQGQAISYETFFDLLQRGDMIAIDRTLQEEKQSILDNPPPIPPADQAKIDAKGSPGTAEPDKKPTGTDTRSPNNGG